MSVKLRGPSEWRRHTYETATGSGTMHVLAGLVKYESYERAMQEYGGTHWPYIILIDGQYYCATSGTLHTEAFLKDIKEHPEQYPPFKSLKAAKFAVELEVKG